MNRPEQRTSTDTGTLGGFTARQLLRLSDVVGLDGADAAAYADILTESLGAAAGRPRELPPTYPSFLSDDHTPVEFSLAFVPGRDPTLRVLLEPGFASADPAENGRTGLRVLRAMARRWEFALDHVDLLEDLFFPNSPQGPLTMWCALELRPGGIPQIKVYLNPAARGAEHAAWAVHEALDRLGHRQAFAALPPADGYPFLALDLGDWDCPRVKVYLKHHHVAADQAGSLSRMPSGPAPGTVETFVRLAAGHGFAPHAPTGSEQDSQPAGRPLLTCHSFSGTTTSRPSGFTLHVPIRDYVQHDAEAHARATALLTRHGMDPAPLTRALAALTSRRLESGTGLISYLALVHQTGQPPRVTAYVSSEAYAVRPPRIPAPSAPQPTPGSGIRAVQQRTQ